MGYDPEVERVVTESVVLEQELAKDPKLPKKYARSQAELKALQQRNDAYRQRWIQIVLVSTNVVISALIALKTFGLI
jgi:hypothetical protein